MKYFRIDVETSNGIVEEMCYDLDELYGFLDNYDNDIQDATISQISQNEYIRFQELDGIDNLYEYDSVEDDDEDDLEQD